MNKVVLIGNLTKDVDLSFAAGSGTAVGRFTVAVARMKKGESDFPNCISFGKTAETIAQYFFKGSKIAIEGHIQTGSYDAKDGTKRYTTDVIVDRFEFVGQANNNNQSNTSSNNFNQNNFEDEMTPVDDGDMPF
ncbi:MAG: single-stranded DNA-binding protein [Clostridium sp.]|uniref:single-stranded DNA-binding protein n=1 Tax=Clostridium sp. TaxID=1506 RepID=UPI00290140FE|nr:single-stranded DNA-binding protein [Clostridium sp.]MDU1279182.1 single-stranded DNA-binding protein [Clostridium sp.]